MRPRIEWLETFIAIVESGSLTRAGERIARSQSAVSLQVRRLEDAVGAKLFEREGRRVTLTPAGEKLLPAARRAVEAVQNAGSIAAGPANRVLRVGVPEEYADRLVAGLLEELTKREPTLSVEVQCAGSGILERRVRESRLDMAFALAEEINGSGEPVATDPVVWLQAPHADLAQRRPLPVALFDHACSWRNRAIEALNQAGLDFEIVFTSASVGGVRAGISSGFAVGVLAESTAGERLERLRGPEAPPPLSPAELVLLQGASSAADARLLVHGARSQLYGRPNHPTT